MFQALALIVDRSDHKNFFLISLSILIKHSLEKLWISQGEVTCQSLLGDKAPLAPLPQTDPEILSLPLTPLDAKPKSLKLCIFVLHHGKTVGIRLFWSKKLSQLVIETKFVYSLIDMHLKVTFQDL